MVRRHLGFFFSGCLPAVLALASCDDGDGDPLDNVGASGGAAGSAGGSSPAGSGGTAGGGGAQLDAGSGGTSDAGAGGMAPTPGLNLLANPSFETGVSEWAPVGNCTTTVVNDVARTGTHSLLTANRTQTWDGPSLDLMDRLVPGARYELRGWVRRAPPPADAGPAETGATAGITLKRVCATLDPAAGVFVALAEGQPLADDWLELSASFEAPTCALTELSIYFEQVAAGVDFYLDDASLAALP
ncbi:MAG TPA: carbohydrate binding domain-containing protein [Polyangiaceae bacterium]|nr:carbohydrate binding domain-containing protein [Polyangiaceae bacterium]